MLSRSAAALFSIYLLFSMPLQAQDPALQQILEQLAEQRKLIESLQSRIAELEGSKAAAAAKPEPVQTAAAPATPAQAPAPRPPSQAPVSPIPSQASASPSPSQAPAQVKSVISQTPNAAPTPIPTRWYEKFSVRGYTQIRHNGLVETNSLLACEQCDRTIGGANNFGIRRARFIFSGDINERVYIYAQPDLASSATSLHFGQLRDLYFDIALDKNKEFRIRAGQSKVPFGFENLQSSQNRLALDRNDALNSAVANERDLGVFFYYAPKPIRARFAELVSSGLKGSGDYGVIGFGAHNGQTANRAEANNDLTYVARVTYPWKLASGQFIEASVQGYTGRTNIGSDIRGTATRGVPGFNYADRRLAGTFVYYPQPWGFQAEYNIGTGPVYDPRTNTIVSQGLQGGYAQTMYMKRFKNGQVLTPFYRAQYYSGGKKHEFDARRYLVRDHELGFEWQHTQYLEVVGMYVFGDRTFEDSRNPNNRQKGQQLRLQLQLNY